MASIAGIGTDIVEIDRVLKACDRSCFLEKNFTSSEIKLINKRKKSAATNFAGKEAVSKAFGTGFSDFGLMDIEILRDERGAPFVNLYGNAKKRAQQLGIEKIFISLSDTDSMAIAYVVAEGK